MLSGFDAEAINPGVVSSRRWHRGSTTEAELRELQRTCVSDCACVLGRLRSLSIDSRLESISSAVMAHEYSKFQSFGWNRRPGFLLLILLLLATGIPSTTPTSRQSSAAFCLGNAWIKSRWTAKDRRFLDSAAVISRSLPTSARRMVNAPREPACLSGTRSLRGSNNEASAAGMQDDGGARGVGR